MPDVTPSPFSKALAHAAIDSDFRQHFFDAVATAVSDFENQRGAIPSSDPGVVQVAPFSVSDPVAKAISFAVTDAQLKAALDALAASLLPPGNDPDCPVSVFLPNSSAITWGA